MEETKLSDYPQLLQLVQIKIPTLKEFIIEFKDGSYFDERIYLEDDIKCNENGYLGMCLNEFDISSPTYRVLCDIHEALICIRYLKN